MAQLPRVYHKIFGATGTSDNFSKFGSAKAGASVTTKDLATIMALSAWSTGWQDAVMGGNKAPVLEEMNGHMFVHSTQIGYLFQSGIPEYDASTTYYLNSIVRVGEYWYRSLVDNNIGNTPPTAAGDANWEWANQKSALPGDSIEWYGLDVRPGCLWQDGGAYSRATYPALFAAINRFTTGLLANGSGIITNIASTARLAPGMFVEGANIPSGAVIVTVDGLSQITIDKLATASVSVPIIISPWGLGDGATTFNVPDKRGRVGMGLDNMGGASANRVTSVQADRLGGNSGTEFHTLITAELAAHTHDYTQSISDDVQAFSTNRRTVVYGTNTPPTTITRTTVSAGSGSPHNNMQPYLACNYVIKY